MGIRGFWNPSSLGLVVVCTSSTRPSSPVEGQTIYETDTNYFLSYDGTTWRGLDAYTTPPPLTYVDSADSLTATSVTAWASHTGILTAPFPLTMTVHVTGFAGFNAVANRATLALWDESNNNIGLVPGNVWVISQPTTGAWRPYSMIGTKNYDAGDACGFKLAYFVDSSNFYIRAGTLVTFSARRS